MLTVPVEQPAAIAAPAAPVVAAAADSSALADSLPQLVDLAGDVSIASAASTPAATHPRRLHVRSILLRASAAVASDVALAPTAPALAVARQAPVLAAAPARHARTADRKRTEGDRKEGPRIVVPFPVRHPLSFAGRSAAPAGGAGGGSGGGAGFAASSVALTGRNVHDLSLPSRPTDAPLPTGNRVTLALDRPG